MSDEKSKPYVNSVWREHKQGPASADFTVTAYYRTKQDESYRAASQDPTTFISAPPFVMTGLRALHPHLKGRMIRIQLHPMDRGILFHGDEPPTVEIPYPQDFKDVTPAFLQLLSRNERMNMGGTIIYDQFGDIAPPVVRALKKLIGHCHITNQSWAEGHGGYGAGRVRHSPPTRVIIDDWVGPQQQRLYNDGSVFHLTPKEDVLNRSSALDNFIRRSLLEKVPESKDGPPHTVLDFKEARESFNDSKDISFPIQPIRDEKNKPIEYVDTRLYSAHIANALVAGAINASTTALMHDMETPGIDYAFLSAGMGYYMNPNLTDFPSNRKPQLYAIYTPGFYEGIYQGVSRLFAEHKENITPIKKISFPFSDSFWRRPIENSINDLNNRIRQEEAKVSKNQIAINALQSLSEELTNALVTCQNSFGSAKGRISDLCRLHGVEVSFAREDALATTRDSQRVRLYRATNNAADGHVMPGNELGYSSVDAAIAQNLLDLANALCPNFNKKMQAFVLDYDDPKQIRAFQQAMQTFGKAIRDARFQFYQTLRATAYFENWQANKRHLSYVMLISLVFTSLAGGVWGLRHAATIPSMDPMGEGIPANITYGLAGILVLSLLALLYVYSKKLPTDLLQPEFENRWHTFLSKASYMAEMQNNPTYIQAENEAVAALSQAVDKIFPQAYEPQEKKSGSQQDNDFALANEEVINTVEQWHEENVAEKKRAYTAALTEYEGKPNAKSLNAKNSAYEALKLAHRRSYLGMFDQDGEKEHQPTMKDMGYRDSSTKSSELGHAELEKNIERDFQRLLKECESKEKIAEDLLKLLKEREPKDLKTAASQTPSTAYDGYTQASKMVQEKKPPHGKSKHILYAQPIQTHGIPKASKEDEQSPLIEGTPHSATPTLNSSSDEGDSD